jgi:two-component system, NarL family, nitrate/nitrite response regulator NarL
MEESPSTIDIVIADDHELFREGLRKLLEAEPGLRIVGEAAGGDETVRVVRQLNPQLLLLDLSMPKGSGLEVLRELSELGAQTRIIVLAAAIEKDQVAEALQLGARGIVLKHSAIQILLKSIHCVNDGQYWVDHESVSDLIQAFRQMGPSPHASRARQDLGLTSREKQVIALIAAGYTNKDLARKLDISEHTVKHHLTNIFDKLGVSNRLELVLYAIDHQLVDGAYPAEGGQ